jgi:type III restriction enzyme
MLDKKIFKQSDLVLQVTKKYDPIKLDLDEWEMYLDVLCGNREYQKEAIKNAIIFMASGKYSSTEDLVIENYKSNSELQLKYPSITDYLDSLQIKNKIFANIDLATGTGKSYVIYGIAQIMLGIGLVERVLVLCPSLTIEKGLTEKFLVLASDAGLRATIPDSAEIKNPRIIDANETIRKGDICVENIHAVYSTTGSSIEDSFKYGGEDTLVLNDEAHHIFNSLQGINANSTEGKNIKKWKEFLIEPKNSFKYIMGLTGTAYIDNEYFNDVIYRYSLRQAIDDKIVKSVDYVQKDDSGNKMDEKFQKIYQNHERNKLKYSDIKPLTILVTKDINKAKGLQEDLIDFLVEWMQLSREEVEKKVLIVTSNQEHKNNIIQLNYVDDKNNPIEWIISVSMLTEGWDVKNVFQIVPWEDRAFNSKLLIAQVLGRGLRIPKGHENPQPSVVVFNHDSWSKNIKNLVDEVLEIETKIISSVKFNNERNKYNFILHHLNHEKVEIEETHDESIKHIDYSKAWNEGIKIVSQTDTVDKHTSYENLSVGDIREEKYKIKYKTKSINEIVNKIIHEFKTRDWEGGILGLGDNEVYSRENLPPKSKIEEIIRKSMDKVGIVGDYLIEENAQRIYNSFSTLFRQKSKTVVQKIKHSDPYEVFTVEMSNTSTNLSSFRNEATLFYTDDYNEVVINEEQAQILQTFLEDESFTIKSRKEINPYLFRTPQNFVITSHAPEKKFVVELCNKDNAKNLISWIKSRDVGFYEIEYSYRFHNHQKQKKFNPDFFIKCERNGKIFYLVVEIKDDDDDSIENKAKYKYGKIHFEKLNSKLEELGKNECYIFHFLSPKSFPAFFKYFNDGRLFESQENFRCDLEHLLEIENE